MAIRILWDEEEAAILLEALVASLEGKITREDAVSSVSQELRKRVTDKGIEIDGVFRNKNGITLQMSAMEYIYTEGKSGLKKGGKMMLFRNVVSMYKNNRKAFEKLLEGARQKMKKSYNVQDEFFAWLATKVSISQLSDFYILYAEIDSFCFSKKIINQKLFETVDLRQVSNIAEIVNSNKAFRHRYKKSITKMSMAIKYYYDFVKMYLELNNSNEPEIDEEKTVLNNRESLSCIKNKDTVDMIESVDEKLDLDDEEIVLDFDVNNNLAYTEPTTISYFEEKCATDGTWKFVYMKTVSYLQEDYPEVFENLLGKNIYGKGRIDIGHRKDTYVMTSPQKITDALYLETNYGATDIIKKIRALLDICNVDYENLEIKYKNKNQEIVKHTLTDSESHYAEILNKYFAEDGYQLGRAIFRGRFKRYFNTEFGIEITDSDEKLDTVLQEVGTVRDGRVFPKQDKEQSNLVEEIINEIVDTLNAGASAVYIDAVYDKYKQRLAKSLQIYHVDALTDLLIDNANGRYTQKYSYLVAGRNNADVEGDVMRVMKASHRPLNYEEIHRKLWFIPYDKMKHALVVDKSIVNVAQETYFYAPNLPINADEIKILINLIQMELEYRSYITDVELMELIQTKLPGVAVNTETFTTYGLRDCLGYILRNQFSFNGPIISAIDKELSMGDVYAEYARQHEKLTLDEIKNLSKEMNTVIYWDSIMSEQVRISEKEFVRRDLVKFDKEAIDSVLDGLCTGDYMPIKDITLFLYFPSVGFQWNSYVLESYLYNMSRKFKLLHASFVQTGVFGAMVRVESNIDEYADLITDVLAKSNALKNTKSALQYIVDNGYQQRLRLTGIEQMVWKAKLIKEKREKEEK